MGITWKNCTIRPKLFSKREKPYSCICSPLVSVWAMKGIPIGPLAQWGKDLTYYLTPFFCLVNWDMYYPGSACRGTDLPPARILYILTCRIEDADFNQPHFQKNGCSIMTENWMGTVLPTLSCSKSVNAVQIALLIPNLSVTLPTSQLILQPFRRFTYVTALSPTLSLYHLRYSSFSNPYFASPTSQALHLRHLASRPW